MKSRDRKNKGTPEYCYDDAIKNDTVYVVTECEDGEYIAVFRSFSDIIDLVDSLACRIGKPVTLVPEDDGPLTSSIILHAKSEKKKHTLFRVYATRYIPCEEQERIIGKFEKSAAEQVKCRRNREASRHLGRHYYYNPIYNKYCTTSGVAPAPEPPQPAALGPEEYEAIRRARAELDAQRPVPRQQGIYGYLRREGYIVDRVDAGDENNQQNQQPQEERVNENEQNQNNERPDAPF